MVQRDYELEAMLTNPSEATEGKAHQLTEQEDDYLHLDCGRAGISARRWTNF